MDGQAASAAAILFGGPKAGALGKTAKASTIRANQAAGNKARDEVAELHDVEKIEKSFKIDGEVRRVDIFTTRGIAIEVKLGRVSMSPTIYKQIMKDVALRANGDFAAVEWVFKYSKVRGEVGPSPSVAMLLNSKNIPFGVAP